jgi:hypothetical protein
MTEKEQDFWKRAACAALMGFIANPAGHRASGRAGYLWKNAPMLAASQADGLLEEYRARLAAIQEDPE